MKNVLFGALPCGRHPFNKTLMRVMTSRAARSHRTDVKRFLLAMKLTALFLFIALLHVSAHTVSQTITLKGTDIPLVKVFAEIEKQTGYVVVSSYQLLEKAKPVTVNAMNEPLVEFMQHVLTDQPFTYKIESQTISIRAKSPFVELTTNNQSSSSPPIDVKGRVLDENGDPVLATIMVKGSDKGTTTSSDGYFELKGVDDDATVVISSANIETREIKLNGRSQLDVVNVKIRVTMLEELVINKGYYRTNRITEVGNVSTITSKEIENQPISNPLLAITGRVPGVIITQNTGLGGSAITVRIQGQNSIGKGNQPLYIIDGVPFASSLLTNFGSILGTSYSSSSGTPENTSGNPLFYLNASDIESIDILKDADATAIYGSRAANGAILITTKRGKAGKPRLDMNFQQGWGQVTRKLDLMNTQQYMEMRHEALGNDGILAPSATDFDLNGHWDSMRYTDWQKVLLGNTSKYSNFQTSYSGGNNLLQYLISATYNKQTTVYPGDFSDQRGGLHFSFSNSSANQRFKLQFTGNYILDDNRLPMYDLTAAAITLPPNAPPLYNTDGGINWALTSSGRSSWSNPLAQNLNSYQNKAHNVIGNLLLSYEVLNGLEFKTSLGFTDLRTKETGLSPLKAVAPEYLPFSSRYAIFGDNEISNWIAEPQITYGHEIGRGKLETLVGATVQQSHNSANSLFASGFISDAVMKSIDAASSISIFTPSTISTYKYNAAFARINYNYLGKYIINFTGRRDGSSRFGSANRFHNFGSVGGAWIFSKENFIKAGSFISFGKLRASYGTSGNDQIGEYQYYSLYNSPPNVNIPYQGIPGVVASSLPNPYLQWEETKKIQFGFELGVFKDKIVLNTTYSKNRSSNQLLQYVLPIFTGFDGVTKNFPAIVQNTTWEFSLNSQNVKNKNIAWTTNVNLTLPSNKLISFPNLEQSTFAQGLVVGEPITIKKVYRFLGVNPTTGIYQFSDSHGSATSTPSYSTDRTSLINIDPKLYGGLQNSFQYKQFGIDMLIQFVKQIGSTYTFGHAFNAKMRNEPVWLLDRWQKSGDVTNVQRYYSTFATYSSWVNAITSDAYYGDASFIRLKNISLSYRIPSHLLNKFHVQNFQFYIEGQNVLTLTNYKGLDPENQTVNFLPPLRIVTVGIKASL